jgi:anionic cell wall polymer biosynthesis LytR-Cps2A-Psr (LCP) family protein
MTKRRNLIIVAVAAVLLLLCVCGLAGSYAVLNTPLSPALSNPEEVFTPNTPVFPQAANTLPTAMPTATAFPTGSVSNCGHSGTMNILVMGVDAPSGFGIMGPLSIRIVRIDFSRKTASVFAFPRDLWLPIKGLESYGFTQARLGESYLIARSNGGMSIAAATNLVAQNLFLNFGAKSDHYITGSMATLASIIDSAGGITVNIPVAYDARPYKGHYFPAGPYYMTGSLALEYAIARSYPEEWVGFDRQSQVLQALFQKLFSPEIIPRIPTLIPLFMQVMTTDLTIQQGMDLVCISQIIPSGQIAFDGIGPNDVTYGASGVLYPNVEVIRAKVQQYLGPL